MLKGKRKPLGGLFGGIVQTNNLLFSSKTKPHQFIIIDAVFYCLMNEFRFFSLFYKSKVLLFA
jgi:hypothetical protein